MAQAESRSQSRLLTLGTTTLVVAALYLAKDFLIPLAMAVLLSFLLAPLVARLQRLGLGRVPSVLTVVLVGVVGTGLLGFIVAEQVFDLSGQFPRYRENILAKLDELKESIGPALSKANQTVAQVSEHLEPPAAKSPAPGVSAPADAQSLPPDDETPDAERMLKAADSSAAIPVKVVATPISVPSIFSSVLSPVLAPLGTVAVVAVLVIFMLIQREDLRNRVIRLVGDTQLRLTTQAIDDASRRVSHYLLMQLIINSSYGVAMALGFWLIGLPNAILWGLLAGLLRFVPYVGPAVGAVMPLVLSLAVFAGWTRPLLVLGWVILLELVSSNVMEPWLYAAGTGVSPLAIIVSAVFWTWLWGGVGLVLSTPITVCLAVLGRHVPQFHFLSVLLGDEPPLALHATMYQRLLALDQDEAAEQARDFLKSRSVPELFDEVLIPTLRLAEEDRHQGELGQDRIEQIHTAVREIIEDVAEQAAAEQAASAAVVSGELAVVEPALANPLALCVPGFDAADELVGRMLVHLLAMNGFSAELIPREEVAGQPDAARLKAATVVWVSALPPVAEIHARIVCKRLRARMAAAKVLVGLWTGPTSTRTPEQLLRSGAMDVAYTLQSAVQKSVALLPPPPDAETPPPASAPNGAPLTMAANA